MTKYREENNKWNFKFWRIVRFYRECGDVGGAEFVKSLYGDPSMMMIRFNSAKHSDKTPGLGFNVTVEAYRSGIRKEPITIYFTIVHFYWINIFVIQKKNITVWWQVKSYYLWWAILKMYRKKLRLKVKIHECFLLE